MRIIIVNQSYFTNGEILVGKKVIATKTERGYHIFGYELLRVGYEDVTPDFQYYLPEDCAEIVQPEYQNCSNLGVGQGWEGFYDQKHVKRSNFK